MTSREGEVMSRVGEVTSRDFDGDGDFAPHASATTGGTGDLAKTSSMS